MLQKKIHWLLKPYSHHELARELKRRGFSFVGPTMAYALMTAIGIVDVHLVSSHRRGCSGLWNIDGSRRVIAD